MESDPIGSSIGITEYPLPKEAKGHPMNYFVPNFGVDREILDHDTDLAAAEAQVGKKFEIKEAGKPHPVDYKVPNFGMDAEVADSFSSLKSSEESNGYKWEWVPPPKE